MSREASFSSSFSSSSLHLRQYKQISMRRKCIANFCQSQHLTNQKLITYLQPHTGHSEFSETDTIEQLSNRCDSFPFLKRLGRNSKHHTSAHSSPTPKPTHKSKKIPRVQARHETNARLINSGDQNLNV